MYKFMDRGLSCQLQDHGTSFTSSWAAAPHMPAHRPWSHICQLLDCGPTPARLRSHWYTMFKPIDHVLPDGPSSIIFHFIDHWVSPPGANPWTTAHLWIKNKTKQPSSQHWMYMPPSDKCMARHGTARHGTARHGTARHGTARSDDINKRLVVD